MLRTRDYSQEIWRRQHNMNKKVETCVIGN